MDRLTSREFQALLATRRSLNQVAEKPSIAQAAQKGPDARRSAKGGVPIVDGSRRTSGTPQRVSERSNDADAPFSAACYGIHAPTAFASALAKALPRLIAVDHVVWHSPRAAGYLGVHCGLVLQAGARLSDRFDRWLPHQQAGT